MDELSDDLVPLLEHHRLRAFDALVPAAAAYTGADLRDYDEGRALLAESRDVLVSVAVSATAALTERQGLRRRAAEQSGVYRFETADHFPARVLALLRPRKLPYAPADAVLLLALARLEWFDDRFPFAVAAAERALASMPGDPSLMEALEHADADLRDRKLHHVSRFGETQRRIRAALAAQAPGAILDLAVLDRRDAWADIAADVLRRHAEHWEATQELLALLASSTGARPSQAWRRRVSGLADSYGGFGALVRGLLEPILVIDLTARDDPGWPPAWLLAPGNEPIARGATWASANVSEPWVVPLLGRLALRCAAPSPHPRVTTALAHVVASGAVEALALIGTPSAHDELRTLLAEIRRRDLLKRIAAVVGEAPAETATRDDRVRREKARAVGATSDPEPRERQREASAAVRRELAPRLAEAGFDDSAGRTFWRALDDRIEVVHVRAHAGGLTLELGIWFRDVPRKTEPVQRAGRLRPSEFACDLRGSVHAWSHELAAAYERSETWFGRFRPLATVIELLLGGRESESAHGFGAPGSPVRALVVGYLARSIGDAETAQPHLDRAAGFFRDQLERYRVDRPAEVTSDWEAWVERLEADAAG